MRRFITFPIGPDVLTVAAVLALAGLVYLCSLPSTFQSLSHRQAGAAGLMGQARERIVEEGQHFAALVRAADWHEADRLGQRLAENERLFHEVASQVANELPEAKQQLDSLTTRFDRLSALGRRAAADAPQNPPETRQDLLEGDFSQSLEELREDSQRMELRLHAHEATYRIELPGLRGGITFSI